MKQIYLDYAASTPVDPRVFAAMQPYFTDKYANPSSPHMMGRQARSDLEDARSRIAMVLGAKSAEIIFTSGSTEAANLAICGVHSHAPDSRVVASAIEHDAVRTCLMALRHKGSPTGVVAVDSDGLVLPGEVAGGVDDRTVLVCVMYANNEIGTIQPIAKIAAEIRKIRASRVARGIGRPLYLYCDAAQAGLLNIKVDRLGVDMLSMGGTKVYGPPGSGFLYVRAGVELNSIIHGGGQERGMRGGTQNLAGAVGLATAIELCQLGAPAESARQTLLRDWLWAKIQHDIPDMTLNGRMRNRLAGNLNITFRGADAATIVAYLGQAGVAVATGSACATASEEPSKVLVAIGCSPQQASQSVRITIGRPTTQAELLEFMSTFKKIVRRVRQLPAAS